MRAIVLSASQGSRLLPMTDEQPACLLPVGSRTLLQWQIEALDQSRLVDEIVVVAGYRAAMVEAAVAAMPALSAQVSVVFDPFHRVAGTLASCWMARRWLKDEVLIVDGGLMFEVSVIPHLLNASAAAATVAMRLPRRTSGPSDLAPSLTDGIEPPEPINAGAAAAAEPIGLVHLRPDGTAAFLDEVTSSAAQNDLRGSFLRAVDRLTARGLTAPALIDDRALAAVSDASDIERGRELAASWERIRIVA